MTFEETIGRKFGRVGVESIDAPTTAMLRSVYHAGYNEAMLVVQKYVNDRIWGHAAQMLEELEQHDRALGRYSEPDHNPMIKEDTAQLSLYPTEVLTNPDQQVHDQHNVKPMENR